MLTPQQELFCREYVARKFNGADAYRAAYPKSSPKSAESSAVRLLGNAKVQERWQEIARKAAAEADVTPAMVLRELKFIAFQRKSQLYRPDGTLKCPAEWDEATDASVSAVETVEELGPAGAEETQEPQAHGGTLKRSTAKVVTVATRKVKRWDKVKALELYMKHFGLLTEDTPHPDRPPVDLSQLTTDALDRLLAAVGPLLAPELRALGAPGEGAPAPAG